MYQRLRFEVVDEFVVGRGVVDGDSEEIEGGQGVRIWGLM